LTQNALAANNSLTQYCLAITLIMKVNGNKMAMSMEKQSDHWPMLARIVDAIGQ
jgi:hypothetical protein